MRPSTHAAILIRPAAQCFGSVLPYASRGYQTPISSPVGSPSLTEDIVITSINIASSPSKASYLKSDCVHPHFHSSTTRLSSCNILTGLSFHRCLLISQLCRGTDKNAVLDPSIRDQKPWPRPVCRGPQFGSDGKWPLGTCMRRRQRDS